MNPNTLSPTEAQKTLQATSQPLLDVRSPAEFDSEHVSGSVLCPLDRLSPEALEDRFDRDAPLLVMCGSGKRATMACEKIRDAFPKATVIEGGISAWIDADLPVERGKNTMSIERQVRIAAGSLVVIGCALAATVGIGFIALPAFVGAGLVFAGVSDTCGMGMLLAKMPWNRRSGGASSRALLSTANA